MNFEVPRVESFLVSKDETIERTIGPDLLALLASSYQIHGTKLDSRSFQKQASQLPIQVAGLVEGDWEITVEALHFNQEISRWGTSYVVGPSVFTTTISQLGEDYYPNFSQRETILTYAYLKQRKKL